MCIRDRPQARRLEREGRCLSAAARQAAMRPLRPFARQLSSSHAAVPGLGEVVVEMNHPLALQIRSVL
eukprot:5720042-Pyramimonas_sp.AAC.1